MKMNRSKYYTLSSLKEIEYEKQFLQYKLAKKEKMIERNWDTISDTWGFLSVAARGLSHILEYIPIGVSAFPSIIKIFCGKSKYRRK